MEIEAVISLKGQRADCVVPLMTSKTVLGSVAIIWLFAGCTFAVMEQLSKPTAASEPTRVEWPEVQPLADEASAAFARRSEGEALANYLTKRGWTEQRNDGKRERSTGLMLYLQRRGGAAVKGADGEQGVCFQFSCSLVQEASGGAWGSPFLDCSEHDQKKVTCESVKRFSRRH
jgi:hypothetical protein